MCIFVNSVEPDEMPLNVIFHQFALFAKINTNFIDFIACNFENPKRHPIWVCTTCICRTKGHHSYIDNFFIMLYHMTSRLGL